MPRVLLGMSGGVDSCVAALLLQRAGYEVLGCCLLLDPKGDEAAARDAAARLGIEFHCFDHRDEFKSKVIDVFVDEYRKGRTPSPCIRCNMSCKFPLLIQHADELGCEHIATGHYARLRKEGPRIQLLCAADSRRDQSYMLYGLPQSILFRLLLPLSDWDKPSIRQLAQEAGLPAASKRDSQDLCFVPDGDYAAFLEGEGLIPQEGDICFSDGRLIGRHKGLHRFTQGQRKGIDVAGPEPYYVLEKDVAANRLIVGTAQDLGSSSCVLKDANWVSIPRPEGDLQLMAKLRYRSAAVPALLSALPDERWLLRLDEAVDSIAPGQAGVFYQGDLLLGGACIERL